MADPAAPIKVDKAPWEIDYAAPGPTAAPTTGYTTPGLPGAEPKIPLPPVPSAQPSAQPQQKAPWEIDYAEPQKPPEMSPFEKAGRAFWEGLGMPTMLDLASGDEARAKHALTTLGQGILSELPRAGQSLVDFGKAIGRGDWTMAGYHAAGAVPFIGAPVQQVGQDIARGDPAAAVGHIGAIAAPFVAGPALGAVGRGMSAAGTVTRGALGGAVEAVPAAIRGGIEKGFYGIGGGVQGVKTAALMGAGKEIAGGIKTGIQRAFESQTAAEAARLAAEQAARDAADAALRRGAQIYETGEQIRQPLPTALPPARGYQMPPAGTSAEEARIAALGPEAISETTPAMVKAAQKVGNLTPEEQTLADHILQNVAPAAPTMTPGQAYAAAQGVEWRALKPNDRLLMEHLAAAQRNFTEQQMGLVTPPSEAEAPITPAERAPTAEMSYTAPATPEPTRTIQEIQQDMSASWKHIQELVGQERTPANKAAIQQEMNRLRALDAEQHIPPGTLPVTPTTTPADVLQSFQQRLRDLELGNRPPNYRETQEQPSSSPPDLEAQLAESIRQARSRRRKP